MTTIEKLRLRIEVAKKEIEAREELIDNWETELGALTIQAKRDREAGQPSTQPLDAFEVVDCVNAKVEALTNSRIRALQCLTRAYCRDGEAARRHVRLAILELGGTTPEVEHE